MELLLIVGKIKYDRLQRTSSAFDPQTSCPFFFARTFKSKNLCSSSEMTVHSPLLKDVPVGKGRYSYQTHASLVEMVYWPGLFYQLPCVSYFYVPSVCLDGFIRS